MEAATSYTPSAHVPEPLQGKRCRIWPYLRGYYPRGLLGQLWQIVENEGAALDIFYNLLADPPDTSRPYETRGDLSDFVEYFRSPDRLLFLVEHLESGEIAGFFWLDERVQGLRATVSLFFRDAHRGRMAFEAGRIFRDYCVNQLGYRQLWGVTPWKNSVAMGRWLGMKQIAVLPQFQRINGQILDVYVIRYEVSNG